MDEDYVFGDNINDWGFFSFAMEDLYRGLRDKDLQLYNEFYEPSPGEENFD